MPHDTPLIATIAIGLGLAFVLGLIAHRLKLPPIIGYLAAGIAVGPFTPGFVADQKLALELAEIGVILLMFGVGLHFSFKDLLSVRAIAIPGALAQIGVATLLGMGLAWTLGWAGGAGLLFGLALSVASTVVLLRTLQERGQIDTEKGRITVGWLIVEDLVMVFTLVLIPPLASLLGGQQPRDFGAADLAAALNIGPVWVTLFLTGFKLTLFALLMLVVGRRVIPWILHYIAHTGSRELFRLAVLAIALGVAYGSARLFDVSFALGAFFAGMVLAESQLSHQAARETLPLRDAFAVLFFVSVGMLFNPAILVQEPLAVLGVCLIVVLGKSLAAYTLVRAFGHPKAVALTISASLAQIGEFSFILIMLGARLAIVPEAARDLIVAGAILSILLNPLLFMGLDRLLEHEKSPPSPPEPEVRPAALPASRETIAATAMTDHAILVGHGRVGATIGVKLAARGVPFLVVDEEEWAVEGLQEKGIEAHIGPCGEKTMLERLNLAQARYLISAIPDAYEAGHLIEAARAVNPSLHIIARAHHAEAADYLRKCGADRVFLGEEELAQSMIQAIAAA